MASKFPAYVTKGHDKATVNEQFTPGTGTNEPFIYGDLVFYDTTDNVVQRCGADPALIAGISEVNSTEAAKLTPGGKVPVRLFTGSDAVRVAFSSATTPADSHIGDSYGVTRSAEGYWQLDTSKTGISSRFKVVAVFPTEGIFECVPHQNILQFADLQVATA